MDQLKVCTVCRTKKQEIPCALQHDGPVVVDFRVEQEENVYPMVATGNTLDQMELGDE